MSETKFAIETRGLSKDYAHRPVLRQIDLELCGGQIVCLLGGNGAGKTTLLGCLAALVRPTSGEVRWFGRTAGSDPAARRWIGMLAHETRLYPQLTLRENLLFTGRMVGIDGPRAAADHWLAEVGLFDRADSLPREVSRGMRQRAALACGLLHDPRIVLLDEPFAGLDGDAAGWLARQLGRLRDAGRLVFLTTHDAERATRLGDRCWRLEEGRLQNVTSAGPSLAGSLLNSRRAA